MPRGAEAVDPWVAFEDSVSEQAAGSRDELATDEAVSPGPGGADTDRGASARAHVPDYRAVHSFVVKAILATPPNGPESGGWRGTVTHVPSGARRSWRTQSDLCDFILARLAEAEDEADAALDPGEG